MKKEISYLVESNSNNRPNDLQPLLSGNTESLEAEVIFFSRKVQY